MSISTINIHQQINHLYLDLKYPLPQPTLPEYTDYIPCSKMIQPTTTKNKFLVWFGFFV